LIGRAGLSLLLLVSIAGCEDKPRTDEAVPSKAFPTAHRPVAPIVSSRYSTEESRDSLREADRVMRETGIKPGMTVADIGAGVA